ncbi:MAG: YcxB family protein [Propionicimonas sp.]|uniref:YcxB family protein n=1 Tax=Propionicimonas sp. TaxID=1955623 RepID=UPI003D0BB0C2
MGWFGFVLTNDDYVAFTRHAYSELPGYSAINRRARIGMALLPLVFAVVFLVLLDDPLTAIVGVAFATMVWFGWPWAVRHSVTTQLRQVATVGDLGYVGPVRLGWDANRVWQDFAGGGCYADWSRIRQVDETPDHLFLVLGETDAMIVPRRAGAGVDALAAFARTQVAMRPPLGRVAPGRR